MAEYNYCKFDGTGALYFLRNSRNVGPNFTGYRDLAEGTLLSFRRLIVVHRLFFLRIFLYVQKTCFR